MHRLCEKYNRAIDALLRMVGSLCYSLISVCLQDAGVAFHSYQLSPYPLSVASRTFPGAKAGNFQNVCRHSGNSERSLIVTVQSLLLPPPFVFEAFTPRESATYDASVTLHTSFVLDLNFVKTTFNADVV